MRNPFTFVISIIFVLFLTLQIQVNATPAGECFLSSSSFSICLLDGFVQISFNSSFSLSETIVMLGLTVIF